MSMRASLVEEHGLQGERALGIAAPELSSTVSGVVVHWLGCYVARWIFLDQASNRCSLHWQVVS